MRWPAVARREFDRIVDVQGELEQGDFLDYAEITRRASCK
jgi:hypothetical protein